MGTVIFLLLFIQAVTVLVLAVVPLSASVILQALLAINGVSALVQYFTKPAIDYTHSWWLLIALLSLLPVLSLVPVQFWRAYRGWPSDPWVYSCTVAAWFGSVQLCAIAVFFLIRAQS